jgi:RNA polymerase sigma-70 factor, ECF subfamily
VTTLADTRLDQLEELRPELTGYCYRMLGSTFDADDAVQDTIVRAWQAMPEFEGRASLRSWVYRIATNVCLDALRGRKRRAMPMDLSAPVPSSTPPVEILAHEVFVEPVPDHAITRDPAELAVHQESVRLAFVAALQHLPPKQRAVLILREVLGWQAAEVAGLLETSVASVNSALQRARATLTVTDVERSRSGSLDPSERELLAKYVAAFESYDIDGLVSLLHEDGSISMPPYAMWIAGRDELKGWYLGYGNACEGSKMIPVAANGMPAFAQYKPSESGTGLVPWSIQVLEIRDGGIAHIHHFCDTRLFERFGVPASLD